VGHIPLFGACEKYRSEISKQWVTYPCLVHATNIEAKYQNGRTYPYSFFTEIRREMIFVQPFYDNFLFHTHIMFYFISLLLWFSCQYLLFLCISMVVPKVINKMVVQITQLEKRNDIWTTIFWQLLWQLSLSYSHFIFTLFLYCFGFRANTHISLYISVVPQVINKNGCSNNIPQKIKVENSELWVAWGVARWVAEWLQEVVWAIGFEIIIFFEKIYFGSFFFRTKLISGIDDVIKYN